MLNAVYLLALRQSGVVDHRRAAAPWVNMYGCAPCPRCLGHHRFVLNDSPRVIYCDDCAYTESVTVRRHDEWGPYAGSGPVHSSLISVRLAVQQAARRGM